MKSGISSLLLASGLVATGVTGAFAQPVEGGTLRIAVHEEPVCIDPIQITYFTVMNIARNFSATLTDQDPVTGEVVPWLATHWEVNADATEYTYHLRDDVTFANGQPFTAQSVKNNLENIINDLGPRANRAYNYLTYYLDSEVIDDHTVKIIFSDPSGHFLTAASSAWLNLYADETLEKTAEERCAGDLIGAGPYGLVSYTQSDSVVIERRDDYAWPAASSENQSRAHIERVEFLIVPESSVRTGLLQTGDVQLITNVGLADEAFLVDFGFDLIVGRNPGTAIGLQFNTQSGHLQDINVRRALRHFINREEFIAALQSSQAQPATSVIVETVPGHVDLSDLIAYDPELANSYLDEAGWTERNDAGIRVKDGEPLVITLTHESARREWGELFQQYARAVGIDLQLSIYPAGTDVIQEILNPHNFEAVIGNATEADPDVLRSYYGPDFRNIPNTEDEWLSEATIAQLALGDPQERAAKIAEIQRHIIEQAYANPIVPVVQIAARAPQLEGAILDVLSRLRLEAAWLDQ